MATPQESCLLPTNTFIPKLYSETKAPIQNFTELLFGWLNILILFREQFSIFPSGLIFSFSGVHANTEDIPPRVLQGIPHAPETQAGKPWLQIKVLETDELPLVERQSTTEKCLTHPLCGITQDVKAQDLSQKCAT